VRGVTDREIRFGIVIPFTGSAKENGQNYKQGIDVAFAKINEAVASTAGCSSWSRAMTVLSRSGRWAS